MTTTTRSSQSSMMRLTATETTPKTMEPETMPMTSLAAAVPAEAVVDVDRSGLLRSMQVGPKVAMHPQRQRHSIT
jgi:hypothetical protein